MKRCLVVTGFVVVPFLGGMLGGAMSQERSALAAESRAIRPIANRPSYARVIEAREFRVLNHDGKIVAVLGTTRGKTGSLMITDAKGKAAIWGLLNDYGCPTLLLTPVHGRGTVGIIATGRSSGLSVKDVAGKTRGLFGLRQSLYQALRC